MPTKVGRFVVMQRTGRFTTLVVSRHHRYEKASAVIEAALEGDAMYILDARTGLEAKDHEDTTVA